MVARSKCCTCWVHFAMRASAQRSFVRPQAISRRPRAKRTSMYAKSTAAVISICALSGGCVRYCASCKPDLVHCHSRRGADMLGGQAAAMESIPAVVSRRVDNPEPGLLASLRYRKFARIVAISNAIRDVLIDSGVKPERIEVIRSTVDTARFAHGHIPRSHAQRVRLAG